MSNSQVVGKREGPVTVRNMRYGKCRKNHAIENIRPYTEHIAHTVDGCLEFMASGAEETSAALTCAACGCHRSFHQKVVDTEVVSKESIEEFEGNCTMSNCQVLEKEEGPVTVRNVRYGKCQKNHAAHIVIGGHALDGCLEFMAGGVKGTDSALTCPACGCHRNFHRRMVDTEIVYESPSPSSSSI